jgi:hypothetical protein
MLVIGSIATDFGALIAILAGMIAVAGFLAGSVVVVLSAIIDRMGM